MSDPVTSSVIATLIFNGALGGVATIIFEYFRPRKVDIYAPKLRKPGGEIIPPPGDSAFSWIWNVWKVSDRELIHIAGMDAYVYLRYLRMCFNICWVCCVGLVVLLPVYATANNTQDQEDDAVKVEGIELYSMSNVAPTHRRLWAAWVFTYLFTFVFLYFTYKEYENFAVVRAIYFKNRGGDPSTPAQMDYTLQVEDIPEGYRTSSKLKEFFEELFPGEILYSYLAITLTPLDKVVQERDAALAKLENAIAQFEASDRTVRPVLKLRNGAVVSFRAEEEVDAIEFYIDQISILSEKVNVLQAEARAATSGVSDVKASFSSDTDDTGLTHASEEVSHMRHSIEGSKFRGVSKKLDANVRAKLENYKEKITTHDATITGFVTMRSRRAQSVARQQSILSEKYPFVRVTGAPAPTDIVWSNMSATTAHTRRVSFFTTIMYYTGLVFWAAILAFIASISNLSTLENFLPFLGSLDSTSYALLQGILPVVIMIVFLALVPIFMAFIAKSVEQRKSCSAVDREVFGWYFMYQLANVYLLLLAGSAFTSLNDPSSVLVNVSASLPGSSVFFINFIITQVFSGIPLSLLRIAPLALMSLIRCLVSEKKMTRRLLFSIPLADASISYGTALPNTLYIVCITLLYWVISPFLLIASTLYFGGSYLCMKYQYMYILVRQYESGGMYWYGLYTFSMYGLMTATILMIAFLGVKKGALQAPLLVPLPILIIAVWRYTESKFKPLSEHIPYSNSVKDDTDAAQPEIVTAFTAEYLMQPNLIAPVTVHPYPYRIEGKPLLDEKGLVDPVYLSNVPPEVAATHLSTVRDGSMFAKEMKPLMIEDGREHLEMVETDQLTMEDQV